jgi:hypothetical protein
MSTAVSDDLARVAARITDWRTAHPGHNQPLPDALWQEIAPLRERVPDLRLCRALHISAHSLRKHCPGPSRHQPHPRPAAPCFVPLACAAPEKPSPVASWPVDAAIRLMLERPDGTRLTLSLPAQHRTELASLLSSLLGL